MRLEFRKRHLSILAFPPVDVPALTVVVGINGSGKTHLLQAILNGSVTNSVASSTGEQVPGSNDGPLRLLSLSGTPMTDVNAYTSSEGPQSIAVNSMQRNSNFEAARRSVLSPFATQLDQLTAGRISGSLQTNEDIWRLGIDETVARAGDESLRPEIERIFRDAEAELLKPYMPSPSPHHLTHFNALTPRSLQIVSAKLGVPPLMVTELQEQQLRPWQADQFQNSLPILFGRYRDAMLRNGLAQLRDQQEGSCLGLTNDEFVAQFGRPPWKQISETFEAFGLPYEAAEPDLFSFSQVHLNLAKKPGGEPVNIQHLSSGEKVLLQFAISSYDYDEDIVNVKRPAVLLLDEMDAPLHPEMVHRWLGVINDGLVAKQGMHCIVTTHSPTTVALAPEAALYEMRDGFSGLTKISKQDALNKLTFGVPTLSIDYSGRRQVFAESDTDAAIYERVYALIKSSISCERELNFLSTGMRNKDGGEINSGCVIVNNIVKQMTSYGARNVFGIVDWDGINTSDDRVKVVAEGVRDGIENVLLDPVLICLLLMKHRKAPLGLEDIDRFAGVEALDAVALQRLADAVQLKAFPGTSGATTAVQFLGGQSVNVLNEYLTINDHDLEDLLTETFQPLKTWSKRGRGQLVKGIIEEVLTEHRNLCPTELRTVFECIANAPA